MTTVTLSTDDVGSTALKALGVKMDSHWFQYLVAFSGYLIKKNSLVTIISYLN